MPLDLLDPGHRLPDPVGEPAHEAHPLLGVRVHPALELRDDVELERIEGDRGKGHHPVLDQEEREDDEEVAALEDRELDRVPEEPAEGLHLGRDHGDDLALGELAEVRQREAQDARVQVVAKPPEQPFPGAPREHVDRVLERLVGDHEEEKHAAKDEQELELGEGNAEHDGREVAGVALDHLVHDLLRDLVEGVEEGVRRDREHRQQHLRARRVPEDVAVDRGLHRVSPSVAGAVADLAQGARTMPSRATTAPGKRRSAAAPIRSSSSSSRSGAWWKIA